MPNMNLVAKSVIRAERRAGVDARCQLKLVKPNGKSHIEPKRMPRVAKCYVIGGSAQNL